MLSDHDFTFLSHKGITEETIEKQLTNFRLGFPFLDLQAAASVDKGILAIEPEDEPLYLDAWSEYCKTDKKILKFVPASGAASRMFKDLFEFLDAPYDLPTTEFEKKFFDRLHQFAFYKDLDAVCQQNDGCSIADLINAGECKKVVFNLLNLKGLNYGGLSKGLLKFHTYSDAERTPVEEHMKEAAMYAKNAQNRANIHFTVSPDHHQLFVDLIEKKRGEYEKCLNVSYDISFSEQKSKTDTIAVGIDNKPFRDAENKLLFRPGGHGALIENLNDLDVDILFIKNIDNVVPDSMKEIESHYKKLLAGVLVEAQKKAFDYLEMIDAGKYTHTQLLDILYFLQTVLCVKNTETKYLEDAELVLYLKRKLNRPFRVCGMVKNLGEPGGGPFLAKNADGTVSPQILESSQINMLDLRIKKMFDNGTHFNPVDLVCGVKDYRGNKFNLLNFVDKQTGFISLKSKDGKDLKALELPGLWNGAMSDWNTIFVEVPVETFNPVKTVNDLLRKEHQNK